MEHPLINDADQLTLEQLSTRISDLQKKLGWASRNNQFLAHQISMALETYQHKYQQKQKEIWESSNKSAPDYSDKIDIS
jgi:hypothetical protein